MWTNLLAIGGLIAGCIVWWALQHASGGERLDKCGHGQDCGSCGRPPTECQK